MLKKLLLAALLICLAAPCGEAAGHKKKSVQKKPAQQQEQRLDSRELAARRLEGFAAEHVQRLNRTLRPNIKHLEVTQEKGRYCAWYRQVDPATVKTEVVDSSSKACKYIGHIVYLEHRMVSYGKTRQEAISGTFKEDKTWRKRELARYDKKKWQF